MVRTDNSAVRYWSHMQAPGYDPKGQVARWLARLSIFNFEIKHCVGRSHRNADAMSRALFATCAQCQTRHRGAYASKRWQSSTDNDNSSQNDTPGYSEARVAQPQAPLISADTERTLMETRKMSKTQTRMRVLTRGKAGTDIKKDATSLPWLKEGAGIGQSTITDQQMKDPTCADAITWLTTGVRPTKELGAMTGG